MVIRFFHKVLVIEYINFIILIFNTLRINWYVTFKSGKNLRTTDTKSFRLVILTFSYHLLVSCIEAIYVEEIKFEFFLYIFHNKINISSISMSSYVTFVRLKSVVKIVCHYMHSQGTICQWLWIFFPILPIYISSRFIWKCIKLYTACNFSNFLSLKFKFEIVILKHNYIVINIWT